MPVAVVEAVDRSGYGRFPEHLERDWLGRWCHLSEADVSLVRRRAEETTRLGFAAQLVTVRALGTFLTDPTAVPAPIVAIIPTRQLGIVDPGVLTGYGKLAVRWKHSAEIRDRYGYTDFTSEPGHLALLRWLYRQAWADDLGPSVLFRAAHRRMLAERVLLPGENVLARLVASVRERATRRLWARVAHDASSTLVEALEALLVVPAGKRRSGLDRLRRPPFRPKIGGLVQALERLGEVRALGVGDLDLSRLPSRRVAGLARYAEDAWATQLADLAPKRRVATLIAYVHMLSTSARDDVIDIFDVVFGDLQRAATNRGRKRRADVAVSSVGAVWLAPPPSPAEGLFGWMLQRGVETSAGHQRGLLMATSGDLTWPLPGTFSWPWTASVSRSEPGTIALSGFESPLRLVDRPDAAPVEGHPRADGHSEDSSGTPRSASPAIDIPDGFCLTKNTPAAIDQLARDLLGEPLDAHALELHYPPAEPFPILGVTNP